MPKHRQSRKGTRKGRRARAKVRTLPQSLKAVPRVSAAGWHDLSPKRGNERETLVKMHPECFLDPEERKFPICTTTGHVDPRGVQAAIMRATILIKTHPERARYYRAIRDQAEALQLPGAVHHAHH